MEIKKIIVKEKPFKCHICNFEPVSDLLYGVQIIDEQLQKDIDERKRNNTFAQCIGPRMRI